MSFGFGVGDFAGAAQLAWNLYRYCYKVARDAPEEFKHLLGEITILSQSIRLLEEEAANPNSTMVRAGEDRVRMVKEMMVRVEVTLEELKKHAEKYEKLGDGTLPRRMKIWAKFKWATDASDLDSLRNKLVYHNGVISLLLNSFGNSSLQRIESSNLKLERSLSEIGTMIEKFGTDTSPHAPPTISAGGASGMAFISTIFMMNAEIGQRRWASIGVDEWIQAGKWWLMKAQMDLSTGFAASTGTAQQAYIDLIKSSWILIDVIARHPQLNLLDSGVRHEVELLANTIKNELGNVETLGIPKPSPAELQTCDLDIWVSQAKGPTLIPTLTDGNHPWVSPDEELLFQRFGLFHAHGHATPAPCIVLLLVHKTDKTARLVVGNQNWTIQRQFFAGKATAIPTNNDVQFGESKVSLSTALDATHLSTLWCAIEEYLFWYKGDTQDLVLLHCLTSLASLKNNNRALFQRLLEDEPEIHPDAGSPRAELCGRLWLSLVNLAPRVWRRREFLGLDISPDNLGVRLLPWAWRERNETVMKLLLEVFDSAHTDILSAIDFHLPDRGLKHITLSEQGSSILHEAVMRGDTIFVGRLLKAGVAYDEHDLDNAVKAGHYTIVDLLVQAGADVNQGDTLNTAIAGGHLKILDSLLQAGADVNDGDILTKAIEKGDITIVDCLLKAGVPVEGLETAVKLGHEEIVEKLLQFGAKDDEYGSSLFTAVTEGHGAIVDQLLRAGFNKHGGFLLRKAVFNNDGFTIEKLLQAGLNENKGYALLAAVQMGRGDIVDVLVRAGADPGDYDTLTEAVTEGHTRILNTLLQAHTTSRTKYSALRKAVELGHKAYIDCLLQAGAKDDDGLILVQAVELGQEATVDKLLKSGSDINAHHALGTALSRGHKVIANKLLQAGANPNGPDISSTALAMAMDLKDEEMVVRLLNAGAYFSHDLSSSNLTTIAEKAKSWDLDFADRVLKELSEARSKDS